MNRLHTCVRVLEASLTALAVGLGLLPDPTAGLIRIPVHPEDESTRRPRTR